MIRFRRLGATGLLVLAACGGGSGPSGNTVDRVEITGGDLILAAGTSATLQAAARTADGADAGVAIGWRSTVTTVATISGAGVVQAVAPGTTRLIASAGGRADTVFLNVAGPVQTIVLELARGTVKAGDTVRVFAQARDAFGTPTPVTFAWSSSDTVAAKVGATGLVLGRKAGMLATITASAGGKQASVDLPVVPAEIASIVISPQTISVGLAGTVQLTTTVHDEFGNLVLDLPVTWSTEHPTVASVDAQGRLTGVTTGTTRVFAAMLGKGASREVTVTAVPVNAWLLEITNQLIDPIAVTVNGEEIGVIEGFGSGSFLRDLEPSATIRWDVIRPTPGFDGEAFGESLGTLVNPTGQKSFSVDNVLADGRAFFTPLVRSLTGGKFHVMIPIRDNARVCDCTAVTTETRHFGYFPLRAGSAVHVHNVADLNKVGTPHVYPVTPAAVAPGSGVFDLSVLVVPAWP